MPRSAAIVLITVAGAMYAWKSSEAPKTTKREIHLVVSQSALANDTGHSDWSSRSDIESILFQSNREVDAYEAAKQGVLLRNETNPSFEDTCGMNATAKSERYRNLADHIMQYLDMQKATQSAKDVLQGQENSLESSWREYSAEAVTFLRARDEFIRYHSQLQEKQQHTESIVPKIEDKASALNDTLLQYHRTLKAITDVNQKLPGLDNEVADWNVKLETARTSQNQLHAQVEDESQRLGSTNQEMNRLTARIQEENNALSFTQELIGNINSNISTIENGIDERQKRLDRLMVLEQIGSRLDAALQNGTENHELTETTSGEYINTIVELSQTAGLTAQEHITMQESFRNVDPKIVALKKVTSEIARLKTLYEVLPQFHEELQPMKSSTLADIQRLKDKLAELEKEKIEAETLPRTILNHLSELRDSEAIHRAEAPQIESRLIQLGDQLREVESNMNSLEAYIHGVSQNIKMLERQREQLEQELSELQHHQESIISEIDRLKTEAHNLQLDLTNLQEQWRDAGETFNDRYSEVVNRREQFTHLKNIAASTRNEVALLESLMATKDQLIKQALALECQQQQLSSRTSL